MPIEIVKGDIFSITADALVVPGNVQPDLNWGSHIAEKVNKLVDEEVRQERKQHGNIPLGDACLTSGKGTGFNYLIHASVLDKYDFNPLFLLKLRQRTSDDTLVSAVKKCKELAESNNMSSVAISAMGAGIGGMNYMKCCSIILKGLADSNVQWYFSARKEKQYLLAQKLLNDKAN
ncbi:MAG: hypothetical protein EP297_14525 [Gammaproteobacteria bacterium]|nr:MAG: hypothetical protein EP297_14525 [Gammaproteobacteria bacterium]